jgi:SpoVK/Ycf46/Vps4 family AAA+-type ATPase
MKNFIEVNQRREEAGMKTPPVSYHCIFTGNPGTGKTTVARIVAGIYKNMGILKKGHLVETDRSGLVAEYVGQTAVKTNKIIDSALDGVLFIDEAYSLVTGGKEDFGKEAYRLSELRTAPFEGVRMSGGYFICTMDGIQIDDNMHAIRADGSAIEGLYVIGDCSGNYFSGSYPNLMGGAAAGRSVTFGRLAGKYAAQGI